VDAGQPGLNKRVAQVKGGEGKGDLEWGKSYALTFKTRAKAKQKRRGGGTGGNGHG